MNAYLILFIKINSKETKDLNVKAKTTPLLEENIGANHHELGFGKGSLDLAPKAQKTKEKRDNLDFIKMQNFCSLKDIIKE